MFVAARSEAVWFCLLYEFPRGSQVDGLPRAQASRTRGICEVDEYSRKCVFSRNLEGAGHATAGGGRARFLHILDRKVVDFAFGAACGPLSSVAASVVGLAGTLAAPARWSGGFGDGAAEATIVLFT